MNTNSTRAWLISLMLVVVIVRVLETPSHLSEREEDLARASSRLDGKKRRRRRRERGVGVDETSDDDDDDDLVAPLSFIENSTIEKYALETTEEIRARALVNALTGETSYASHMIASNVTWFDRAYVKEKLDFERFVKCSEERKGAALPDVTDIENVTPDKMKRKVTLSWMPTDEMRGLDVEMKTALENGEEEDENASEQRQMNKGINK